MKKFLSVILVLILAISTLLVTACKNDDQAGTDDVPYSSEDGEFSSTRKRHSGSGNNPNTGTPSDTGDDKPTSSDDPSSSPTTPTSSEFEYGYYDYSYSTSLITPTEYQSPAGILDLLIYTFVDTDYPRPTLEIAFYQALSDLEQQYNALSATEKANVQNYQILLEARAAYNDMAKQECTKLINELPEATIDNLTTFGTTANAIQALIDNIGIGEASKISNKADFDNKVAKADTLLVNTFNQKVDAIKTFEYSTAYKAKLDDADVIFGLMNASQKSKVASSYATLNTMKTRYADATVAYKFVDIVNALPDIDQLGGKDQATIKDLKRTYNKMTAAEKAEIPAATQTKYDAYITRAKQLWPEHVLHTFADTKQGDVFFKFNTKFNGANRPEAPVVYEGVTVSEGLKFIADRRVTFTPQKAGVLTVYANIRAKEDDKCDMVLKFNGQEIDRKTVKHDATGENCEYVFTCNQVGTYELSAEVSGDGGILYYLIFS